MLSIGDKFEVVGTPIVAVVHKINPNLPNIDVVLMFVYPNVEGCRNFVFFGYSFEELNNGKAFRKIEEDREIPDLSLGLG